MRDEGAVGFSIKNKGSSINGDVVRLHTGMPLARRRCLPPAGGPCPGKDYFLLLPYAFARG